MKDKRTNSIPRYPFSADFRPCLSPSLQSLERVQILQTTLATSRWRHISSHLLLQYKSPRQYFLTPPMHTPLLEKKPLARTFPRKHGRAQSAFQEVHVAEAIWNAAGR
eukprot:TRINITY_DN24166_c0_g1_i1.p2 TRINITY_DN24166_c0_g1~~TRINITY_DN24166_c0_g1_i1.p2  ORF type:complete len:108 (+),score=11.52 TRINITY_DN24166_c0_g1_i1:432-755(+)